MAVFLFLFFFFGQNVIHKKESLHQITLLHCLTLQCITLGGGYFTSYHDHLSAYFWFLLNLAIKDILRGQTFPYASLTEERCC